LLRYLAAARKKKPARKRARRDPASALLPEPPPRPAALAGAVGVPKIEEGDEVLVVKT
jgi:hypothetical protein